MVAGLGVQSSSSAAFVEDRLAGLAVMRLMVLDGTSFRGREAQFLMGQDDLG